MCPLIRKQQEEGWSQQKGDLSMRGHAPAVKTVEGLPSNNSHSVSSLSLVVLLYRQSHYVVLFSLELSMGWS